MGVLVTLCEVMFASSVPLLFLKLRCANLGYKAFFCCCFVFPFFFFETQQCYIKESKATMGTQ